MRQNLRCQLVTLPRAAPLRQQTSNASGFERGVRVIGGRQRDAEQMRRRCNRHIADAMLAHHLVAHLQQVVRVEESAATKERIDDVLRIGIERAGCLERRQLGVGAGVASGRIS
jgi:hypothetical protein